MKSMDKKTILKKTILRKSSIILIIVYSISAIICGILFPFPANLLLIGIAISCTISILWKISRYATWPEFNEMQFFSLSNYDDVQEVDEE